MGGVTDWTNGLVAIYGKTGQGGDGPVGAGFLASAAGHILTCAHVLEQAGWPFEAWDVPVQLRFLATRRFAQAFVRAGAYRSQVEGDMVVLTLAEPLPDGIEVLPLAAAASTIGHTTYMWGYPAGYAAGLRGEGRVLGLVPRDGHQILQLRSTETTRGYSGSPVWDQAWGRVIGMTLGGARADELGRLAFTTFAAPAEALVELAPDWLALTSPEVLSAQATRHISGAVDDLVGSYTGRVFVGRDGSLEMLDGWVAGNASGRMLVTAPAGYGKTALLANWLQRRQAAGDSMAFHFFSDRDERLRTVANAYGNLLGQLAAHFGLADEALPEEAARPARLRALIEGREQPPGRRLIILLDALDECEEAFQLPLPASLPDGVFLVASARAASAGDDEQDQAYLAGWRENAASIHLDRLPDVALAGWLAAAGDGALAEESQDAAFLQKLAQVSDGYPLYLRYLLDDLLEAKAAGHSPRAELEQPASGFGDYVGRQLRRLSREIGREKVIRDFFVLLAVARYALLEDEVTALTELTVFDLASLPAGLTRWLNIFETEGGQPLYALAHSLLAQEFESALRGDARRQRDHLLAWCSQWSDHRSPYALRHYAVRLHQAGRYEDLYALARNWDYAGLQEQVLPAEPELPLRVVREALDAASGQRNAALMAEFLLAHARRVTALRQASPLAALRDLGGEVGLARAHSLALANDAERRLLWLLLLAWELAEDGHAEDGHADQVPGLFSGFDVETAPISVRWRENLAAGLFRQLLPQWPVLFLPFAINIFDDRARARLALSLSRDGHWDLAAELAGHIAGHRDQAILVSDIAIARADAGHEAAALATAAALDDAWATSRTLRHIANRRSAGDRPGEALETAMTIPMAGLRAGAMGRVAAAYHRAGDAILSETLFIQATELAESLADAFDSCLAFKDIAAARAETGQLGRAGSLFAAALTQAGNVDDGERRDNAYRQIAMAQAWSGFTEEALDTAARVEDIDGRSDALADIIAQRAAQGDFAAAFEIAEMATDERDHFWALNSIAAEQARAGQVDAARETIGAISQAGDLVLAWCRLAQVLARTGEEMPAWECVAEALAAASKLDDLRAKIRAQRHVAAALVKLGDTAAAQAQLIGAAENALALTGDVLVESARIDIAWAQARAGDGRAARDAMAAILHDAPPLSAAPKSGELPARQADGRESPQVVLAAEDRVRSLLQIGVIQSAAGDRAGALATYEAATAILRNFPEITDLDYLLSQIGQAQAQAGDTAASSQTAGAIEDGLHRDQVMRSVAEALAVDADFAAAAETAGAIEDADIAVAAFGAIAIVQAAAGMVPDAAASFGVALEIAARMDETNARAKALGQVAADQARAGFGEPAAATYEEALTAAGQDQESLRSTTYMTLAERQAAVGHIEAALLTVGLIELDIFQLFARTSIAEAQARAGDLENARETAAGITGYYRVKALVAIATSAALSGEAGSAQSALDEALVVAKQIDDYGDMCQSLSLIGVSQVETGHPAQAMRTASQILTGRDEHLPPIARALAAAGDAERLGQLLLMCAQDPKAALSALPSVVTLYPDQAAEVAEVVIGG